MRYTVILVPGDLGRVSASVPAMPGCFSLGTDREGALVNVQQAIAGWIEAETEQGRRPLTETPELVLDAVSRALATIDDMRVAGEMPIDPGYELELATIEVRQPVAA